MKISEAEKAAGQRADFRVYYKRRGKTYFDAMWAASAEDAEKKFLAFARELRWAVEIIKTVPITPTDA